MGKTFKKEDFMGPVFLDKGEVPPYPDGYLLRKKEKREEKNVEEEKED